MEMPCTCRHCGEMFDLNDGYSADVLRPDDEIICESCHYIDNTYSFVKDQFEEITNSMADSIETIKSEEKAILENKKALLKLVAGNAGAIEFLKSKGIINDFVLPDERKKEN